MKKLVLLSLAIFALALGGPSAKADWGHPHHGGPGWGPAPGWGPHPHPGPVPTPVYGATCHTEAGGYPFQVSAPSLPQAQMDTMRQCNTYMNAPWGQDDWSCRQNLTCWTGGPHYGPGPGPGGPEYAYPCYGHCNVGEKCTDGCPWGAMCNYLPPENAWRVIRCNY